MFMDQKECFRDQHARINQHRIREKKKIKEEIQNFGFINIQSLIMRKAAQEVKEKYRRNICGCRIGSAISGNCSNKAKILYLAGDHDHIQNRQLTRLESKKIPQY